MLKFALVAWAAIGLFVSSAVAADNEPTGQMVVLKAAQIGQIFCLSRLGNDEAVIAGILTQSLRQAIADAEAKDADYAKKNPDEKPPLGDGIQLPSRKPSHHAVGATSCLSPFASPVPRSMARARRRACSR